MVTAALRRAWRRYLERAGFLCIYCHKPTLARLTFGGGRFRVALCEPCHQEHLPEVPHP